MCYVAGLNRIGTDGKGVFYNGKSAVHNCLGTRILYLKQNKEITASINLDKQHLLTQRKRFGFLNDRDQFKLIN